MTVTVANAADTTPPTVSHHRSASGTTVSGVVTIAANASDNVGVAGVQFLVDNNLLAAEDTGSPYSVTWNTTTAANGAHTLTARARDAAGNTTTSAPVTITVANAACPAGFCAGECGDTADQSVVGGGHLHRCAGRRGHQHPGHRLEQRDLEYHLGHRLGRQHLPTGGAHRPG